MLRLAFLGLSSGSNPDREYITIIIILVNHISVTDTNQAAPQLAK